MLSKSQIKLITSLDKKKYRNKHQLFVVEGIKSIEEFLYSDYELYLLFSVGDIYKNKDVISTFITEAELKKISFLSSPNSALAVFKIPESKPIGNDRLIVALDGISDPGNLGTIIRLCDWFGIKDLICSSNTVDCFNPKVVQSSMGSLTRVNITYLDLEDHLINRQDELIYGAFMNGESIYSSSVENKGILVFGNESNGIREEIEELVTSRISIPQFGQDRKTESLNVAMATAIMLSEFTRRTIEK
ncbi:MAG: RNA methyltransferase [Flavobacteriaceae bacterium]|nr:RNA methyltransferase [Flavobacteriaceae bacterium]